jgi:putative transposase
VSSSVIHQRFQRWTEMGIFEKLMKKMVEHYAKESGLRWKWQAMDSKSCAAPLGGEKSGKNPTDRGKLGTKIHVLVDGRGAPLSVVLTGANHHDKIAAMDLIVSVMIKRPVHKEQHLCANKAYDAKDVREFVALEGYEDHIKVNPRKAGQSDDEELAEKQGSEELYPARRWVVERTISWLTKRRSLRTRWSKKAENWLALVQFACAHVLLNLTVFG